MGELGVDGVVHEEINAVPAEAGAHVVVPAVQPIGQFPAQAEGDAPVLHRATEPRRKTARKALIENKAVGRQIHLGVVCGRVGCYHRTAFEIVGQVGHPDRRRAVFKRVAPEHPAAGVGIAEKEVAFGLAFGIVAKRIQAMPVGQVQAQVAEEFVIILHGRCAEKLRRLTNVVVAGGNQLQRIVALHAAAGLVAVHELETEVGKALIGQRQAEVAGHTHLVAVALVILAPARFQHGPLGIVAQHEIQRSGNGVGAVLRRSTVTQYFQPLERNGRNDRNISPLRAVRNTVAQEGNHRGTMPALAVDQYQGGVGRQAAHIGRTDQGGGITGAPVDVVGRHGGGQQRVHVPDAVGLQVFALDHIYRHQRVPG